MPCGAAVGTNGLKSWVMVLSGELSMTSGWELADAGAEATGSTVTRPALRMPAVATARTLRLNDVFRVNFVPLLRRVDPPQRSWYSNCPGLVQLLEPTPSVDAEGTAHRGSNRRYYGATRTLECSERR